MARWFHNGNQIDSIPIDDRGFQYGDGVFETIAIRQGKLRLFSLHAERLLVSGRRMHMAVPGEDELQSLAEAAVTACECGNNDALLKIIVTRGSGNRGYKPKPDAKPSFYFGVFERTAHPDNYYSSGVAVRICRSRLSTQPQTAGMKTLSRLDQVIASSEEGSHDYQEGLMMDPSDNVICGTMSNVFLVHEGNLITPALTECGVSGVMRRHIIALADKSEIDVTVRTTHVSELSTADEIFLCNNQFGIWPVSSLHLQARALQDWPVTSRMMSLNRESGVIEGPQ